MSNNSMEPVWFSIEALVSIICRALMTRALFVALFFRVAVAPSPLALKLPPVDDETKDFAGFVSIMSLNSFLLSLRPYVLWGCAVWGGNLSIAATDSVHD